MEFGYSFDELKGIYRRTDYGSAALTIKILPSCPQLVITLSILIIYNLLDQSQHN